MSTTLNSKSLLALPAFWWLIFWDDQTLDKSCCLIQDSKYFPSTLWLIIIIIYFEDICFFLAKLDLTLPCISVLCPFLLQTMQAYVLPNTFSPDRTCDSSLVLMISFCTGVDIMACYQLRNNNNNNNNLPASAPHSHNLQISTSWHPVVYTLKLKMLKPSWSVLPYHISQRKKKKILT